MRSDADREFIINVRYWGTMPAVGNLLLQRCIQVGAFTLWKLIFCGAKGVLLMLGGMCQSFRLSILIIVSEHCALAALRIYEAIEEASLRIATIPYPLQCMSVYPNSRNRCPASGTVHPF